MNEFSDTTDVDVVSAFTYDTTNEALVHELGRERPRTNANLLNIATKFANGEDAVAAIFCKEKSPHDFLRPSSALFLDTKPTRSSGPVKSSDPSNFRIERLQFEVVDFSGSYNAILRWLFYAKFMAIPSYTYLNPKMLGPRRIITASASFMAAYTCEQANCELASALVGHKEATLRELMAWGTPRPTLQTTPSARGSRRSRA